MSAETPLYPIIAPKIVSGLSAGVVYAAYSWQVYLGVALCALFGSGVFIAFKFTLNQPIVWKYLCFPLIAGLVFGSLTAVAFTPTFITRAGISMATDPVFVMLWLSAAVGAIAEPFTRLVFTGVFSKLAEKLKKK